MMEKANDLIAHILEKKPLVASECKSENLKNVDPGCIRLIYLPFPA